MKRIMIEVIEKRELLSAVCMTELVEDYVNEEKIINFNILEMPVDKARWAMEHILRFNKAKTMVQKAIVMDAILMLNKIILDGEE